MSASSWAEGGSVATRPTVRRACPCVDGWRNQPTEHCPTCAGTGMIGSANWELPEESGGVHVDLGLLAKRDMVAEHLRRVLGIGESVTVLDTQRAVRIVERFGPRTELLYMEVR